MEILSDKNRYLKIITSLDKKERKFIIDEVEGEEQISGLFYYNLKLRTPDNNVDFEKIMGESVTVSMEMRDETKRYLNGIVTRFEQAEYDSTTTTYYAEIRPWLWQLTLTRDSKIFQNMKITEIIPDIFKSFGFSDYKDDITGAFEKREYCVQYQETAFDFVSRLMEEAGIFYYFEHTEKAHTLIMANDKGTHKTCPGVATACMTDAEQEGGGDDLIRACALVHQLTSNSYAIDDFNFETPATDLVTSVKGKTKGKLRIYKYPGGFIKTKDGDKIAKRRIESYELPGVLIRGEGYCKGFIAGYKFQLKEHVRKKLNSSYVLRRVSIQADQEIYTNAFEAFPATVPFSPRQIIKKPKIYGTQTAIVVGKQGEEIWPDKLGRVKVQFHWDQEGANDEKSSCWIRVAQVWAGKNWGTLFIPRLGAEVIVSFLEGDPDYPIIIGTVYNSVQTLPYELPGEKNKSTIQTRSTKDGKAGNEIRFDDTIDEEELYFHAQKDQNIKVENNRTVTVLKDETITIKKNRTTTIEEENETLTVAKGDREITVTKGTETHSVKGTRSLTVTDAETHKNDDGFTHKVKKDYVLKVDGDLTIDVKGEIKITSKDNVTIKASKNVTVKASKKLLNQSGKSLTNKAGTALLNKAGKQLTNQAGTALLNKAGTALTNKAGTKLTNQATTKLLNKGLMVVSKGSASAKVDGGGMLTLKGGLVKIG